MLSYLPYDQIREGLTELCIPQARNLAQVTLLKITYLNNFTVKIAVKFAYTDRHFVRPTADLEAFSRWAVNRSSHCSKVGYPFVKVHIEVGDSFKSQ